MSFLKLVNLSKSFNTDKGIVQVIKNISIDIKKGEFVAIVGPSGCGKTTLLKIIAGLEKPDDGSVLLQGEEANSNNIVLVFQNPLLFPWATVQENVGFGLRLKGIPKIKIEKVVLDLLKKIGLNDFKSFYPHQLSGGMQQKVALARALAVDPVLLLMDEPFASLDAIAREELQEELINIWRMFEKTIVLVTHSLREALLLADIVYVLTPRPTVIKSVHPIEIPRPRNAYLPILSHLELKLKKELAESKKIGNLDNLTFSDSQLTSDKL
ncbi:MAG: ABC transporter ATP-binding protein [Deltaproteobacteria bacterium]|nr:ABC transporter ATP-binding protein [Deltaproteobacteria bacterium]